MALDPVRPGRPEATPTRFTLVPAASLLDLFAAARSGAIPWLAVRLYFAQRARAAVGGGRSAKAPPALLARALGRRVRAGEIDAALAALERAGLVRRDLFDELEFPTRPAADRERWRGTLPRRVLGRPIPLPHWLTDAVVRSSGYTRAAVLVAHAVRCLWRDRLGNLTATGRVSVGWVARAFGLGERQVSAARAELVRLGLLKAAPVRCPAATVRLHGERFELALEAEPPVVQAGGRRSSAPPRRGKPAGVAAAAGGKLAGARENEHSALADPIKGRCNEHRPMRAAPQLRIPRLDRAALRDPDKLAAVHRAASAAGRVSAGPAGFLEVAALAESALRRGRRNAPGLLFRLLEAPAAARAVSAQDEDRARARVREGYGHVYPSGPAAERPARAHRERQRPPAVLEQRPAAAEAILDRLVARFAGG